ncbi:MAG: DUF58 domain-containing protein [Planctomycetota bacterium]|nr:MAG: DUF58 domain-containing protein [Planctomycetota bacterium]
MLSELDVKGLRLMRRLPAAVFAGEPAELEIVVHNPRRLVPAWVIEIGELEGPFGPEGEWTPGPRRMLAHLPPGEKAVLTVRHRFARRGAFALSGFELRTRFPFGFFTKYARASLPAELLVLPAIRPLAAHVWLERLPATGDRQRAGRRQRGGDEFRSLRDYRRGDPPRWIHWRSSARTGALQVREFEPLRTEQAVVVVDTDPGPLPRRARDPSTPSEADRALDRVADLAASLLAGLGRREVPRRLVIAANTGLLEPPVGPTATPQLGALEALARLAPGDDPHGELLRSALERVRGPAALYVVTAREPGLVDRLLGRHGSGALPARVLSVRTEADTTHHYAASPPGTEPLDPPCDTPRPELATP